MSKIDGIYCVLIKADLKTLVLLNKKQNIVLKIAIFIFASSVETYIQRQIFS